MMQPLLEIRDLSLSIHGTSILKHVSLTVNPGEAVAVIGESGAGKSSTAQLILGLQPEESVIEGSVYFAGEPLPIEDDRAMRRWRGRSISMIFQDPMTRLNPYLRVKTQILEALGRAEEPPPDPHARVLELLRMVELKDAQTIAEKHPHELSGGQQQRVMIAMALANTPKLLIADEPTSSLDACVQADILTLLMTLQRRLGVSLLLITHDMGAARRLAHRVLVMRHGEVVESASAEDFFAHPKSAYAATLVGIKKNLMLLAPRPGRESDETVGELDHVSYTYPSGFFWGRAKPVLTDLSLRIQRGENLGVLGESGSGKSTAAKLLAGLIQSESGRISLFGERIDHMRRMPTGLRKRCQIVFQNPFGALNPRLTIEAALMEPLELMKIKNDKHSAVVEALSWVNLPEAFLKRYPHELSGGERQRVSIARGLLSRPDLLICDEIVSALDPTVQVQVLQTLRRLQEERGFAMFFISHDLEIIRSLSTRIAVIYHGALVEYGLAADVLDHPQHSYTQRLLAASRIESAPQSKFSNPTR